MTTKKLSITGFAAAAILIILAIFNFSAGAERKAMLRKIEEINTIASARQLALDAGNTGATITVKGIYSGNTVHDNASFITLVTDTMQQELLCSFASSIQNELNDIPLQSAFVVAGKLNTTAGKVQLLDCRLISVNIAE